MLQLLMTFTQPVGKNHEAVRVLVEKVMQDAMGDDSVKVELVSSKEETETKTLQQ